MKKSDIIYNYRDIVLEGKCINLVPIKEIHFSDIVRIRNQEKNRYYLNQEKVLKVESQKKWYSEYLERDNDLYWCIENKEGIVIGTVRIYNIDDEACHYGSFIIDENYTMGLPYALETEILVLDFVFQILKLSRVINEDRVDNIKMNAISKKMGFEFEKEIIIRDVAYNRYVLKKENSQLSKYTMLLDKFMNR